jgi:DHA1 family inner membrane transport protein
VTAQQAVAAIVTVFLAAALGSVLVVNLQMRLMQVAGDAQTLGAALNHASLNAANALGAWLGGVVLAAGWGLTAPSWVGVGLSAAGLAVLGWSAVQQRRAPAGAV